MKHFTNITTEIMYLPREMKIYIQLGGGSKRGLHGNGKKYNKDYINKHVIKKGKYMSIYVLLH